ncbi:MAG: hypothetical protein EPGJADBJ_02392 [Saprospiraceae bacterium]|nr:hypothetical protein [Saprospiraceae bacterium]
MKESAAIVLFSLLFSCGLHAQRPFIPTDSIRIFGMVDSAFVISFEEIVQADQSDLGNFRVANHRGEFKKELRNVKGVELLKILEKIKIKVEKPRELNECYLIFKASDGYAVVFSWNEIFNTEIGRSLYIVTEADGKYLTDSSNRILTISTKDFNTGRRHVKNLSSIEVKRI